MNTEGSGFEAFSLYHSLKLHFTSKSYHFIKYNGKSNITKDSFMKRRDKYSFYRLSRKFDILELKDYLISNFVYGKSTWIGEMMSNESEEIYKKWMKINQSMLYVFTNDVETLLDCVDRPDDLFTIDSGGYPKILLQVMEDNISLETFVILNDILNFFPMFDKKIQEDIIWPNFRMKCEKYLPFITYDKIKYKNTLLEKIKENAKT